VFRKVTFTLNLIAFMAHALFGCCSHHLFAADTCGHSHYQHLGVALSPLDSVAPASPTHGCGCHHGRNDAAVATANGTPTVAQVSTVSSFDAISSESFPCDTTHECDHDRCEFIGSDSSTFIAKICWVWVVLQPRDHSSDERICLQRWDRNQVPKDASSSLGLCAQHQSWQV
jgi:hypothetical protein